MRVTGTMLTWLLFSTAVVCARGDEVSFTHDIAPIVLKRCTGCHGERANLGGYRAHTFQSLMKAGGSGQVSILPGRPEASRLFQLITAKSDAVRMPQSDDPLSAEQISLIRRWILAGAKFDGSDPAVPLKNLLGPRRHPAAPAVYRVPVPIMAVTFAPGGEIAVGGYNEVTLWNPVTGSLTRRLNHLPQRIQTLAFSRDGRQLLVAGGTPGEYGEVARVDVATGQRTSVLDTFNDIVLSAAFSSDGAKVVAGSADGSVRVYRWESGRRLWTSRVHSDWVTSVCFSSDGRFVASASKDMTVKVYEAETGALYATYTGHNRQIGQYAGQSPVYAVAFLPGSSLVCSAGGGRWIHVWDPEKVRADSGDAGDMEERFAKQGHTRYIEHGFQHEVFALTAGTQTEGRLFAASADGIVKQFDLTTLQAVRTYTGATDWIYGLAYDATPHRVAAGSYSGELHVWDSETGQLIKAFAAQPGFHGELHTAAASGTTRTRSHSDLQQRPVER